jgi:fucose permease
MTSMQAVTALTISGAVVSGMALALFGTLKLALARRLPPGDNQLRALLLVLYLALVPATLLAGVLIDRWGVRPVMIAGSVALALALLSLNASETAKQALAAVFLAGLGVAALSGASLVLMPRAFFGSREPAASLQIGTVFFALGALVTAPLTDVLLRLLGERRTLPLLAFLCLAPAFVAALPARSDLLLDRPTDTLTSLFTDPDLWLAGLVLFFYAPLEASVTLWTTTHLGDHPGRPDQTGRPGWLLASFWAAFLGSRLLVGLLEHAGFLGQELSGWLLVLPALLAAVVLGHLAAARREGTWGALVLLGLLMGPIFPTLLTMTFRLPGTLASQARGTAYGILFAAGTLGSLLLAPVLSRAARHGIGPSSWRLPIFLALILTAVSLVFSLFVRLA